MLFTKGKLSTSEKVRQLYRGLTSLQSGFVQAMREGGKAAEGVMRREWPAVQYIPHIRPLISLTMLQYHFVQRHE